MKKLSILLLAASTALVSCSSEDDNTDNTNANGSLKLDISNLAPTEVHERYEGWVIVNGAPVSTGLFEVGSDGTASQTSFSVPSATLDAATMFVLSLEPHPDSDPAPSDIKIIGGAFSGNMASVDASHPAALNADFGASSGSYILATPTTADMMDERSGVWFIDISGGSPAAGLNLPALPANWAYEGWAVIDGTPVSTGTFSAVDMQDGFNGFSGMDATGPSAPGEDFIANAPMGLTFPTDLRGATIVVSIEPVPDNSPAPFAFKPLVSPVSASAEDHVTYSLNNQVNTNFPSGNVTR
jgi:hypothetical protein